MKRLYFRLLTIAATGAVALATPAVAQMDHSKMKMPGMATPTRAKTPVATKPPVRKPTVKQATVRKALARKAAVKPPAAKALPAKKPTAAPAEEANPHAGHDMSAMPDGHDMSIRPTPPSATVDPHAGHDMSALPGMEMPTGHDMSAMTASAPAGTDLPAGTAPPPDAPADHAADAVFGPGTMAMGRHHLDEFHGAQKFTQVMFNIAEYQARKGRDGYEWDGEAWYGGDINRLWLKTEGDGEVGEPLEKAELQALYSRAIDPYFNLQAGVRYDFKPNPSRVYATIGFEGLAPGFFDVEGALFLSNEGELMARAEGYYDQRITQRLILQPRAELNFAAQSTRETKTGAGLSDAEFGLRLRYDIRREFAPYVGVQYSRAFGNTRKYLREIGEDAGGWSLLTGVRMWF